MTWDWKTVLVHEKALGETLDAYDILGWSLVGIGLLGGHPDVYQLCFQVPR